MRLKEFISEDKVYTKVENEIREWVESAYKGLSIDFLDQTIEIVKTDKDVEYTETETMQINEVVNIKIGDILEDHAEEIYIAERLTRIWRNHPRFDINVESIQDIKKDKKFLKYLKELIITPVKKNRKEG